MLSNSFGSLYFIPLGLSSHTGDVKVVACILRVRLEELLQKVVVVDRRGGVVP